jgi:hypothetical protein
MITENRYYSRIAFTADAEVYIDGVRYAAEMLDLSLRGTLLHFSASAVPVNLGVAYPLKINLPSSDMNLRFDAELVHQNGDYAGFRFQSLDVDSMTHLRKILDLNTGDHVKLTHEMEFWLSQ